MSADLQPLGRTLVLAGVILLVLGLVLLAGPKLPWLGRLPGDIRIERPNMAVYIPLGTSLLLSAVLSLLIWIMGRFRQ